MTISLNEKGQVIEVGLPNGGGTIRFQNGPIKETGVNGAQIDDVLEAALEFLRSVNKPPHASRQTSLAITKVEEAIFWLNDRTRERRERGVEGTSQS